MRLAVVVSPFAAFALLMLVVSAEISLFASAGLMLVLTVVDAVQSRSPKILQLGGAVLFATLGAAIVLCDLKLPPNAIRAIVDAGLLSISLGSLVAGVPFTVQYARESVDDATARRPLFHRINIVLTLIWSASFAVMLAADVLASYAPMLPLWTAAAIAFAARNGAMLFTRWYPAHRSARAAAAASA